MKETGTSNSYKEFMSAAVVCNNEIPCTAGKNILAAGGSVVDAAITSMLTLGVISFQSSGIGGGFFIVYYDAKTGKDYFIDARSVAPLEIDPEFYVDNNYAKTYGRSSIAVPGEIHGFWEIHQRFGILPWSALFKPAIELAEKGFRMTASCSNWLRVTMPKVKENENLRNFLKKSDGTFKQTGDYIKRPNLAATLRIIAEEGAAAFYNGSLTKSILDDINDGFGFPSAITIKDFNMYRTRIRESTKLQLDNFTVISTAAPSGGNMLAYLLKILHEFNLSAEDLRQDEVLTYHRIIEAMKFTYYKRNVLGDPDFCPNVNRILKEIITDEYCKNVREKIDDSQTHPLQYYGEDLTPVQEDHGTGHLGIIGEDGSAVAMTSTVNQPFGSNVLGRKTGIVFNDQIGEYSIPGETVTKRWRPNNLLEPGKRALSTTCPTIILSRTPGGPKVKMIVGGSGGTRIVSATALTIIRTLWFHEDLDKAVKSKRLHHTWYPNVLHIENGMDQNVVRGLKERGHKIEWMEGYCSTVQAILKLENGRIAAKCDERRGGYPDGF
ncbi:glutathione hydrolase 1 proenzyme-like [Styela clava]